MTLSPWTFGSCPWPLSLLVEDTVVSVLKKNSYGIVFIGLDNKIYSIPYVSLAESKGIRQLDGKPCGELHDDHKPAKLINIDTWPEHVVPGSFIDKTFNRRL